MALEQEVYAQAPGASRLLGRSGEQCVSEKHDTVEGLMREEIVVFQREGKHNRNGSDKTEIPASALCRGEQSLSPGAWAWWFGWTT